MTLEAQLTCLTKGFQGPRDPRMVALGMLWQAYQFSLDTKLDRWQFALEVEEFRRAGVLLSELRWLIVVRVAHHAREITLARNGSRRFALLRSSAMPTGTSLVLTDDGVHLLDQLPAASLQFLTPSGLAALGEDTKSSSRLVPEWHPLRRELRYDGRIVKCLPSNANNQTRIITAFQEERWAKRIDDPIPPTAAIDPRRRMHDTVKQLNRNRRNELLHFRSDGTGQGIVWEAVRTPRRDVSLYPL